MKKMKACLIGLIFTFNLFSLFGQQKYKIDTIENLRGLGFNSDSSYWYNVIIAKYETEFKLLYSVSFIEESKFQLYKGSIFFITTDSTVIYVGIDSNKSQVSKIIEKKKIKYEKFNCIKTMLEKNAGADCLIYLNDVDEDYQKFKHLYFVNHNYKKDEVFSYYMKSLIKDSFETKIKALTKAKYFDSYYSFYNTLHEVISDKRE